MNVLQPDFHQLLEEPLSKYALLPTEVGLLVSQWVSLRAATVNGTTADDRERRQNDTWIAASALSTDAPLPTATGNLQDFRVLAAAGEVTLIHPDL